MASPSTPPPNNEPAGLDDFLKGLRDKAQSAAPPASSEPDDAAVKRMESGQRDPGTDWKRELLNQGEEFGGNFLVGATHPWEEPSKDLSGPAYWGQEIGGYAPGVAASFIPGGALVKSGVGAVSGLTAPADSFSDRLVHGAEGAATGLLPVGINRIPAKVYPALDDLASMVGGALFGGGHGGIAGGGIGGLGGHYLSQALDKAISAFGGDSLSGLIARHILANPALMGRAAAQGSDAAGVTGGEGSESRSP